MIPTKHLRHVAIFALLVLAAPGGQARTPVQAPAGELGTAIAAIDARITSEFAKDGVGAVSIVGREADLVVMLGHGGSTAGYLAAALFNRGKKLGVIVLRNCDSCPITPASVAAYSLEQLYGK